MKRLIIYIICVFFFAATNAQSLVERADSAYNKEDYRLAIRLYNQAINSDGVNPEIYYNLANAYYRIDNLGRAVLYYERALKIDPSYTDARTNLNFVKTKILDRPEDDSSFLDNVHRSILSTMKPNAWAWLTFVSFVLLLGCAGVYIFSSNVQLRKTGFFGGFVVMIVTIYFAIIAYQSASALHNSNTAVIIVPTANLRSKPGNTTEKNSRVIQLHEGTVVEVTDSMSMPGETTAPKWYNVKINNSTKAWVNAADVERI